MPHISPRLKAAATLAATLLVVTATLWGHDGLDHLVDFFDDVGDLIDDLKPDSFKLATLDRNIAAAETTAREFAASLAAMDDEVKNTDKRITSVLKNKAALEPLLRELANRLAAGGEVIVIDRRRFTRETVENDARVTMIKYTSLTKRLKQLQNHRNAVDAKRQQLHSDLAEVLGRIHDCTLQQGHARDLIQLNRFMDWAAPAGSDIAKLEQRQQNFIDRLSQKLRAHDLLDANPPAARALENELNPMVPIHKQIEDLLNKKQ